MFCALSSIRDRTRKHIHGSGIWFIWKHRAETRTYPRCACRLDIKLERHPNSKWSGWIYARFRRDLRRASSRPSRQTHHRECLYHRVRVNRSNSNSNTSRMCRQGVRTCVDNQQRLPLPHDLCRDPRRASSRPSRQTHHHDGLYHRVRDGRMNSTPNTSRLTLKKSLPSRTMEKITW